MQHRLVQRPLSFPQIECRMLFEITRFAEDTIQLGIVTGVDVVRPGLEGLAGEGKELGTAGLLAEIAKGSLDALPVIGHLHIHGC